MLTDEQKGHYELLLYDFETTGRTDFRNGAIKPLVQTKYHSKPGCWMIRPPPLKFLHSMSEWKENNVPFSMMHRPKEIIRTNPWKVQEEFRKPEDHLKKEVQNTRPRIVMTPALYLDDIEDRNKLMSNKYKMEGHKELTSYITLYMDYVKGEQNKVICTCSEIGRAFQKSNSSVRELLVNDVYTTSLAKVAQDSGSATRSAVRAPLSRYYSPANPVYLRKLQPPVVSPEWRMDSVSWDDRQIRTYCDATKEFWLNKIRKR